MTFALARRGATGNFEPAVSLRPRAALLAGLAAGALATGLSMPNAAATTGAATSDLVYEWGNTVPTSAPNNLPTAVENLPLASVDAGNYSDVVVTTAGTVFRWADAATGDTSPTLSQVLGAQNVISRPVDGNGNFAAIEKAGLDPSCPASTTVIAWTVHSAAQVVSALSCKNVVQLAKAAVHTFALTSTGNVYAWGGGQFGVLGLGAKVAHVPGPTLIPALTALTGGSAAGVTITTGMNAGSLMVNGKVWSWGNNSYGQCGCDSTAKVIATPTPVSQGATRFSAIDQGGNLNTDGHVLALDGSGQLWAWGDNAEGQLGTGTRTKALVPVQITSLPAGITAIAAGGEHSLALDGSGRVWAWGYNQFGQVGNGSTSVAVSTPVIIGSGVTAISAGSYHSLAVVAG